jgi:hypothetical protein
LRWLLPAKFQANSEGSADDHELVAEALKAEGDLAAAGEQIIGEIAAMASSRSDRRF